MTALWVMSDKRSSSTDKICATSQSLHSPAVHWQLDFVVQLVRQSGAVTGA